MGIQGRMDNHVFEGDFGSKCVKIELSEQSNCVVYIVHRYEKSIAQIVAERLTSKVMFSFTLTLRTVRN
jgi:L-lactate utilization protein LutB